MIVNPLSTIHGHGSLLLEKGGNEHCRSWSEAGLIVRGWQRSGAQPHGRDRAYVCENSRSHGENVGG
jgi:hypothetical protein